MEEKEALKRQIELLQNLINKHKSIYGDTPFARVEQSHPEAPTSARGRGHSTSVRGRQYTPQIHGSWRKTYSLRNKNPQSSVGHPSASTSSSVEQSTSRGLSRSISLPSKAQDSDRTQTATLSSDITQQKEGGHKSSITGIREDALKKTSTSVLCKIGEGAAVSQHEGRKGDSTSTGGQREHIGPKFQKRAESRPVVLVGKKISGCSEVPSLVKVNTSTGSQCSSQVQIKPSLSSKIRPETKQSTTQAALMTGKTTPVPALSKLSKQPPPNSLSQKDLTQVGTSSLKKSKFTWVKSQNIGGAEPRQGSSLSSPTGKIVTGSPASLSKPRTTGNSHSFTISRRTPAKKLPRKLNPVTVVPKTSKYKWVSSSAVTQAKTPRKPLSPKALTFAQRALEKAEATMKLKPGSTPSAKIKKGTSSSLSSRYRWKAGGQGTSVAMTGGAPVACRRSAFHWTSEKSNKGMKGGLVPSPVLPQRAPPTLASPGGFKLRSRMKIIRRSASSAYGTEKGSSPSAVKYSPRGRIHTSARSPIGVRRTSSRELVSFGRHKLRRLSSTSSRTSPTSSSHRSPASQRVFRTRYKMVTRPGCNTLNTLPYSPALSWRVKKIQSARSFLQNRCRAPHDTHPSSIQYWRGSSMCWIRGSLYQVSANKLSRTVTSNTSINRTGRSSSAQVSSMVPAWNRHSTSRHLASRAVQRSLAIIRHARQKKQQKQYCMFYNRFGKCNRGSSCPYIHDPDKVAVCTRFLRGTCKQADGTCPFSHKVAKEKMPVCSYFLKGICNNSDCPYSHVYVSRKAEVCEDFVRGYCPEGEKCKKKHTLVCPDFSKTGSCPRGARCKLQHRLRAKRSSTNTSTTPAKKARTKEPTKRPPLSVVMPQDSPAATGTPTAGPLSLPSFISLSSSPEEADAPDTLPAETSQVKEKKLQIKPRL